MKKIIAMILVFAALLTLAACGKTETVKPTDAPATTEAAATDAPATEAPTEPQGDVSPAQMFLADFKDKVGSAASMEELAQALVENEQVPFMGAFMPVEEGFLNGFNGEIQGFTEGATFAPMIGAIPFVGYVFKLADASAADAFIQTLKDSADMRWNICTSADELVCEAVGDVVFFVMAPASFEE